MHEPTNCPECEGTNLVWYADVSQGSSGVPHGRLRLNEAHAIAYLACEECSETVMLLEGGALHDKLNASRPKRISHVAAVLSTGRAWAVLGLVEGEEESRMLGTHSDPNQPNPDDFKMIIIEAGYLPAEELEMEIRYA